MTTSAPTPVISPGSPAPRAAPTGAGRAVAALRGVFRGSVGQLRLVGTVLVVASLAFGLLGASAFRDRASALADARSDTAQLVRVQTIQTALVQADAEATNAFLVGGLEPTGQRAVYDNAIASVAQLIAEAARAQPADAKVLGRVNDNLSAYTERIALARANNRQGFPVGSAYLRQASTLLRQQIVPDLVALTEDNRVRTSAAFDSSGAAGSRLGWAVLIGLFALIAGGLWLSLRTHRLVNAPIAVALLAVLAVLLVGGLFMAQAQSKARDVRSTSYTATYALAKARVLAYDAKSQESLGLIARGSAGPAEAVRVTDTTQADRWYGVGINAGATTDAAARLSAWVAVHQKVRTLDDGGDWDAAVALATGAGTKDSNAVFETFAVSSSAALGAQAKAADHGLASRHDLLVWSGWATLLLGLFAAVASWLGIAQRLEEYR